MLVLVFAYVYYCILILVFSGYRHALCLLNVYLFIECLFIECCGIKGVEKLGFVRVYTL